MKEDKPKKRGRGRPPKKPIERPKFNSDADFRQYLLGVGLDIVLDMKEQALKKGNIKKPEIARAKTQQYKVVLDAIKTVNTILKDKQMDILETKIKDIELGLITDANSNDDIVIDFNKLQDNFNEIKESN